MDVVLIEHFELFLVGVSVCTIVVQYMNNPQGLLFFGQ